MNEAMRGPTSAHRDDPIAGIESRVCPGIEFP